MDDATTVELIERYEAALARRATEGTTPDTERDFARADAALRWRLEELHPERPKHKGICYLIVPDPEAWGAAKVGRKREWREAAEIDAGGEEKPAEDTASDEVLDRLWLDRYVTRSLCGLCGGGGTIDTRGRAIGAAGIDAGGVFTCICPNGRALRAQALRAREDR